jgi:hypothetical protein
LRQRAACRRCAWLLVASTSGCSVKFPLRATDRPRWNRASRVRGASALARFEGVHQVVVDGPQQAVVPGESTCVGARVAVKDHDVVDELLASGAVAARRAVAVRRARCSCARRACGRPGDVRGQASRTRRSGWTRGSRRSS